MLDLIKTAHVPIKAYLIYTITCFSTGPQYLANLNLVLFIQLARILTCKID
jgi:hypothetical protein